MIPELFGGSADLTGSNNTNHKQSTVVARGNLGANYLHYGVREFGMTAIMNGIALHGGVIPYGGTFLVFSDYARNARAHGRVDETGSDLGLHARFDRARRGRSDAPADRAPVESADHSKHGLWRPCDTVGDRWLHGATRSSGATGPTSLVLTRQALPAAKRDAAQLAAISRSGYVLSEPDGAPECVLIATGSEVGLALDAARELRNARPAGARRVHALHQPVRRQDRTSYRDSGAAARASPRVAIEAGAREGWWRYVGSDGAVIGMTGFGASAPAKQLFPHFGFTRDHVIRTVEELLTRR